jgi:PelA/Pel-15E family pectate lyase
MLRCTLTVMAWAVIFLVFRFANADAHAAEVRLQDEVVGAMKRAASYYRFHVASHGGYVYYYTPDLQTRWGEGAATADQIWVQPPGTPTVGLAFLKAHEATADKFYLDSVTDAAMALIHGQLQSGAWTNCVDFNPRGERLARYRNGQGGGQNRNFSTLDDGISQAAIRLMMHADRAHGFRHQKVHDSAQIALDALLNAQFPNGGFPQGWDETASPRPPAVRANYPHYDWRTEGRIKNYWDLYTLNDQLAGTVAATLIDAHEIYQDQKYKDALVRLGDFLILAQMPDPQPAWAQQYNYDMQPVWARAFEPPAITANESQDVLETLLTVYRQTGDQKYLEPIPRALAYLRRSLLADGRLARYYELESNKPLYMTREGKQYTLSYDDSELPAHYGWKTASRLDAIERAYNALKTGQDVPSKRSRTPKQLENQVRQILRELDDQGRWITTYRGEPLVGQPTFALNTQYLSSAVFSRNIELLSDYLSSTK